jgi:hypothetical protein
LRDSTRASVNGAWNITSFYYQLDQTSHLAAPATTAAQS